MSSEKRSITAHGLHRRTAASPSRFRPLVSSQEEQFALPGLELTRSSFAGQVVANAQGVAVALVGSVLTPGGRGKQKRRHADTRNGLHFFSFAFVRLSRYLLKWEGASTTGSGLYPAISGFRRALSSTATRTGTPWGCRR